MNTRIVYLYRDGANNKQRTHVVLEGSLTADQIAVIEQTCDERRYFIPGDVGLPKLQAVWVQKGYPLTDDNHVWHELEDLTPTDAPQTLSMTATAFHQQFVAVLDRDVDGAMTRVGVV